MSSRDVVTIKNLREELQAFADTLILRVKNEVCSDVKNVLNDSKCAVGKAVSAQSGTSLLSAPERSAPTTRQSPSPVKVGGKNRKRQQKVGSDSDVPVPDPAGFDADDGFEVARPMLLNKAKTRLLLDDASKKRRQSQAPQKPKAGGRMKNDSAPLKQEANVPLAAAQNPYLEVDRMATSKTDGKKQNPSNRKGNNVKRPLAKSADSDAGPPSPGIVGKNAPKTGFDLVEDDRYSGDEKPKPKGGPLAAIDAKHHTDPLRSHHDHDHHHHHHHHDHDHHHHIADERALHGMKLHNFHAFLHTMASQKQNSLRSAFEPIVVHPFFELGSDMLIFANLFLMGITLQVMSNNVYDGPPDLQIPTWSFLLDQLFLAWFIIELIMRTWVHGHDYFFNEGKRLKFWNNFEIFVTFTMTIEQAVLVLGNGDMSIGLVVLRMIRSARCVAVLRRVATYPELLEALGMAEFHTLLASVFNSGKVFLYAAFLVFITIYLMALFFTQLVLWHKKGFQAELNRVARCALDHGNDELCECKWGIGNCMKDMYATLGMTMSTLFQVLSGGIGWREAMRPITVEIWPPLEIVFIVLIAFLVFHLTNIITGVFVDTAVKSARTDREEQMRSMVLNFLQLAAGLDGSDMEVITYEKFKSHLDDEWMKEYFEWIDVDLSEAKRLFQLLDVDGSGEVGADEFLSGCMRLRGGARALDLQYLAHENRRFHKKFSTHARLVEKRLNDISRDVK